MDSASDNGYYEIIVEAPNQATAKRKAVAHLKEMGRSDLIEDMEPAEELSSPLFHSTVQSY